MRGVWYNVFPPSKSESIKMAQPTMAFTRSRTKGLEGSRHGDLPRFPQDRTIDLLYFPLETECVLTAFRKRVLHYIYRTARGLSSGRLESARVSLTSTPDEEDYFHLDLTLRLNADWDTAQALTQDVLDRVSEWSEEWPETDREDYGRWIYFGVIPTNL